MINSSTQYRLELDGLRKDFDAVKDQVKSVEETISNFSDLSIIGSDIYQTEIVNNQVKQIAAFQRLLKSLALK